MVWINAVLVFWLVFKLEVDMLDEFEKKELERLRKNYELCGLGDRAQSLEIESIIRMVQLEMKERKPENESVDGANQASD